MSRIAEIRERQKKYCFNADTSGGFQLLEYDIPWLLTRLEEAEKVILLVGDQGPGWYGRILAYAKEHDSLGKNIHRTLVAGYHSSFRTASEYRGALVAVFRDAARKWLEGEG